MVLGRFDMLELQFRRCPTDWELLPRERLWQLQPALDLTEQLNELLLGITNRCGLDIDIRLLDRLLQFID
jgi:hypothetical protein